MSLPASRRRALIALAFVLIVTSAVVWRVGRRPASPPTAPSPDTAAAPSTAASGSPASGVASAPDEKPIDFRAELERVRALPDRTLRSREFARILQQWLQRDPTTALAYVRALPRDSIEFTQGLLLVLDAVAKIDPDRALALAAELATTRDQQNFYSSFFYRSAQENPTGATQRLAKVPGGLGREFAVRAMAAALTDRDANAALTWAQTLDPSDRPFALESVIAGLVATDPLRAIQLAQQSLRGAALDRVLGNAVTRLIATDLPSAAAIVPLLPGGETQTAAAAEVARQLAAKDPNEALAWVKKIPVDAARSLALTRALETWAAADAAAAGRYVAALPPSPDQRTVAIAVGGVLARSNPQDAIAWAQTLPVGDTRAGVLANIADVWAQRDAPNAAEWLVAQPADALANLGPRTLHGVLSYWVLQDPAGVREFVRGLNESSQTSAAEFVAPLLAQNDPAAALTWAQSLAGDAAREAALTAAFNRWQANAPAAAQQWLATASLPPETKSRLTRTP